MTQSYNSKYQEPFAHDTVTISECKEPLAQQQSDHLKM